MTLNDQEKFNEKLKNVIKEWSQEDKLLMVISDNVTNIY